MKENRSKKKNVISAGAWYIVSTFLMRGIGFLATPFFARMMTTQEYGIFNNFTICMTILATLTTLDLYITVSRAMFDFKEKIDEYLSSILILSNCFTILGFIIIQSKKEFFVKLFGLEFEYIQIMFLYLFVYPAIHMFQMKERQSFQYKISVAFSLITSISSVGFSFMGVYFFQNKLAGRILGYIIPLIFFSFLMYFFILLKGRKVRIRYWTYSLKIAVPLIPHTLSGNILGTSDQIIIKMYCGASDMAIYSLAYTCSIIISILWQALNQAVAPWIYLKLDEGKKEEIKTAVYYYLTCFIIGTIGIMLIAPEIIQFMGGAKYKKAIYILPVVMTGCVFQFAYSFYANVEIFFKKTMQISMATLFAALLNLVLNFIFVPRFGYLAAAYTTLIGYAALLLFHYNVVKYYKLDDIYDNKFIFSLMFFLIIIMFVILFLYKITALRWFAFGIYTILILFGIKKFKLIEKMKHLR